MNGSSEFPKIADYDQMVTLIKHEIGAKSRIDLLSFILGEFEDNGGHFPLTRYGEEYKKFIRFANSFRDFFLEKKGISLDSAKRSHLVQALANYVWYGKNQHIGRKRSYKEKKAQLYSFTTTQRCNCLCLGLALISIARVLHLPNIYMLLSEVHVWIGYLAEATEALSISKVKENPSQLFSSEIMTPDGDVGLPIRESLLHSWSYLIPTKGGNNNATAAIVADDSELLCSLITNLDFEKKDVVLKIRLLCSLWEETSAEKTGFALVEMGDSFFELKRYHVAIRHYVQAYGVSIRTAGSLLYYPLYSLGECLAEMQEWYLSLQAYAGAFESLSNFKFTRWDDDILKELNEDFLSPLRKEGVKLVLSDADNRKRVMNISGYDGKSDDLYGSLDLYKESEIGPESQLLKWSSATVKGKIVPTYPDVLKLIIFIYDKLFYWFESSGKGSSIPIGWLDHMKRFIGQFSIEDRLKMLEISGMDKSEIRSSLIANIIPLLCLGSRELRREIEATVDSFINLGDTNSRVRKARRR